MNQKEQKMAIYLYRIIKQIIKEELKNEAGDIRIEIKPAASILSTGKDRASDFSVSGDS